ncbi:MAG: hypothetical protein HYV39_02945 [Candidatus Levybacteria bacterium]|nr:hypothetical protein [Candidatus Levybacteria bacterium]
MTSKNFLHKHGNETRGRGRNRTCSLARGLALEEGTFDVVGVGWQTTADVPTARCDNCGEEKADVHQYRVPNETGYGMRFSKTVRQNLCPECKVNLSLSGTSVLSVDCQEPLSEELLAREEAENRKAKMRKIAEASGPPSSISTASETARLIREKLKSNF